MRIVIHAGFHKTGTKSVQSVLETNRDALAPHLRIIPKSDLPDIQRASIRASVTDAPEALEAVQSVWAAFVAGLDADDPRPVLISAEEIAGLIPGRRGVTSYAKAPQILRAVIDGIARGQPGADPELYFTTREAEAWLRSVWWQNLRSTRTRYDFDEMANDLRAGADLDRQVRWIRAAVNPVPVHGTALDRCGDDPLGPAALLFDLLGIDVGVRAALVPARVENAAPRGGLEAVFLALNRCDLPDQPVKEAKTRLFRAAKRMQEPEPDV